MFRYLKFYWQNQSPSKSFVPYAVTYVESFFPNLLDDICQRLPKLAGITPLLSPSIFFVQADYLQKIQYDQQSYHHHTHPNPNLQKQMAPTLTFCMPLPAILALKH